MGNEVPVATTSFLDDHLGVPHDEAAEDEQGDPQVHLKRRGTSSTNIQKVKNSLSCLENQVGLEKDVQQPQPQEHGQGGEEGASKVQVLSIRGKEGGSREAGENHRREQQGIRDDGGVYSDGHV